jgi:thioredoxin reductase
MAAAMPEVKVGQVWADNDPRSAGRTIKVISVGTNTVRCEVLTVATGSSTRRLGSTTMISRDRFRPTSNGYRLIEGT